MTVIEVVAGEGGVTVAVPAPAPGPAFASSIVDADGGLLTWPDVTRLTLPHADIDDVSAAQGWLWDLYGPDAALAVAVAASGGAPVRVTAGPGALARPLAALALGHWAARWWPASLLDGVPALDPDLLGLELAVLAHRAHRALPPDTAADLLADHRPGIAALSGDHSMGLLAGLAPIADLHGVDIGALPDPAGHPALGSRTADDHALAAGPAAPAPPPGARILARGHGVNDWCRHPAGLLDAAETAVSWAVHAHGAARVIEVHAVMGPLARGASVRPTAEIVLGASAPVRLPLEPAGDAWAGRTAVDLPATAVPDPDVHVLLPGFDPGPSGPEAAAARDRLRALAARRLDLARGAHAGSGEPPPFLAELRAARADEDF
ncbi:hypothetical protein [Nocardiopsis lambiniae]|uniref:Uncharacterized protein n=1 Tax=Nocardiopsis lambiniae TaxID=3075539 RepID=A0ABU2MB82_9ACTN|nr:hypothetical protein [Nocardiopsis sp. DSM 44743]MDT0329925.1 hypothetical protein [Nocardiopsis sp. DSM 44743]